jgi:hypothetical protein
MSINRLKRKIVRLLEVCSLIYRKFLKSVNPKTKRYIISNIATVMSSPNMGLAFELLTAVGVCM